MKAGVAVPGLCWTRPGPSSAAKRLAAILRQRPGLKRRSLQGSAKLTDRLFRSGLEHALEAGWVRKDGSGREARFYARQRVVGLMVVGAPRRRTECLNYAACLGAAALESPAGAGCPQMCAGYQEGRMAV